MISLCEGSRSGTHQGYRAPSIVLRHASHQRVGKILQVGAGLGVGVALGIEGGSSLLSPDGQAVIAVQRLMPPRACCSPVSVARTNGP